MAAAAAGSPPDRPKRHLVFWVALALGIILVAVVADRLVIVVVEHRTADAVRARWGAAEVSVELEAPSGVFAMITRHWDEVRIDALDPTGDRGVVSRVVLDLTDVGFDRRAGGVEIHGEGGRARLEIPVERLRRTLGFAGRFLDVSGTGNGAVLEFDIPVVGGVEANLDVSDGRLRLGIGDVSLLGEDVEIPEALRRTTWPIPVPRTTDLEGASVEDGVLRLEVAFGPFAVDRDGDFVDP